MSATHKCQFCGRDVPVTVTGRLRKHKKRLATMDRIGAWCENTSPHAVPKEQQ